MIRIQFYQDRSSPQTDIPLDKIASALGMKDAVLWVSLSGEDHSQFITLLQDTFRFHPLAVEDALHESHAPKLDDWGDYLYIVLHDLILPDGDPDELETPELDIFLGKNFIVSHHHQPIPAIDRVWTAVEQDDRIRRHGPDRILFSILQELIHDQLNVLQKLEERVEDMEDLLFERVNPSIPAGLFALKRSLLDMRRMIVPQQEIFIKLSRDRFSMIDARDKIFFRDVHDQAVWMFGLMENLRDLVTSTLETYLSIVNNRMNQSMRLMAVITTLFLPLTFITGFFGMNFFQAAGATEFWTATALLEAAVAAMLVIPIVMFLWMKRRGLV